MAMYNTTPTTITAGRKAGAASRIQWCERYTTWAVISGLFTVVVYPWTPPMCCGLAAVCQRSVCARAHRYPSLNTVALRLAKSLGQTF